MKKTNIILFSGYLDPRAGGPSGYLSVLNKGLSEIDSNTVILSTTTNEQIKKPIWKNFPCFEKLRQWNRNRVERRHSKKFESQLLEKLSHPFPETIENQLKDDRIKTIHVHHIYDAIRLKKFLDNKKLNKKIILTSHAPESVALETCNTLKVTDNQRKTEIFNFLSKIEKDAYEFADILIFPSKEAMDPLFETIPEFNKLIENKKICFVPTGCTALVTSHTKEEARNQYGIRNEFTITFVGRHNSVKGYDILKDAAIRIKEKHPNLRFFIAGNKTNISKELTRPYWNEVGYVDPSVLLKASDCFILPNRRTFYDLVLLEALSVGIPIIASTTGGNKSIMKNCSSLLGFNIYTNPVDNLIHQIESTIKKTNKERDQIAANNKKYYMENHTPKIFAKKYVSTIQQIHHELEI